VQATDIETLKVEFIERVKHIFSQHRTNDEELDYARTITESADVIEIVTSAEQEAHTEVIVSTPEAVYHFRTFRADYVGHASRTLVELLAHFHVNLPIDYVIAHKSFTVYLHGDKVVASEKEYPIAERAEGYELVEMVQWKISAAVLDIIYRWADKYQVEPIEFAESAVRLMDDRLAQADSMEEEATE
jgi:hypothetical protein